MAGYILVITEVPALAAELLIALTMSRLDLFFITQAMHNGTNLWITLKLIKSAPAVSAAAHCFVRVNSSVNDLNDILSIRNICTLIQR